MAILVVTGSALIGVSLVLTPPCLLGCETVATAPQARAQLVSALPGSLPDGVEVTHVLSGGFQDRFVQIRLVAPDAALPALLALFGTTPDRLAPASDHRIGAAEAPWWPLAGLPEMQEAMGSLAGFHAARIGVAPNGSTPGHNLVFVFAWQI